MTRFRSIPAFLSGAFLVFVGSLAAQESLTLGASLEGLLQASDTMDAPGEIARLVPLDVPMGTRLVVTLESPDFDAYLALVELTGTSHRMLTQNDDAPGLVADTDARVRYLPREGVSYAVWVGSYDGTATGGFTLTATEAASGERFPIPLETGRWVASTLDGSDPRGDDGRPREVWEFGSDALDRVLVLARGPALPEVKVVDPADGAVLARSREQDGVAFLDWFNEVAGSFEIEVAGGAEGAYDLRMWMPPVTTAELTGLQVGDELRHDAYGFSIPSPGPSFAPRRALARPHNQYSDGYTRIWYLQEGGEGPLVTILFGGMFARLSDATFREFTEGFFGGFAEGREVRRKDDGPRSARAVIPRGSDSFTARCVGTTPDADAGRLLCVGILADAPDPKWEALLNGMVLR